MAPMLRRAILAIITWLHDPDDLGLQPFDAGCFALPMAHDVRPVAHRDLPPGRGLGAGISGHGHIGFGRHHKGDRVLVQPPERGAIQTALISDDLLQAGHAGQIHPRLGDQGPGPEGLMLVNLLHFDRQGNLGAGSAISSRTFQP
jgi:hypothetical protein